ncbi:MAG TPA: hypothetical protein VF774_11270 [Pseudoduganella sp.]
MNIYQAIWDADQAGSGVKPLLANAAAAGNDQDGHIRVMTRTETLQDPNILFDLVLPQHKRTTYELVHALFDNYALDEQDLEAETPQEREEIHNLLDAVVESPPMLVARQYVEEATGTSISTARWYATLLEMWFRTFRGGSDPALSGFEHVFVGEQQGPKVQGYHFWYKYYLDDGMAQRENNRAAFPGLDDDRIVYLRGVYKDGQEAFAESVTISYKWMAPDYDAQVLRPLTKPTGGFFVGCSVEGLMALGTVRAHLGARAPKEAVINGARYELKVFRSENDQHIRTFYPVYLGPAGDVTPPPGTEPLPDPIGNSKVRIVAALVNPGGNDPGGESVILANGGAEPVALAGFVLRDANRKRLIVADDGGVIPARSAVTVNLPRGSIELSNKGGEITLLAPDGKVAHRVSYSKAQARREGELIYF